MGTILNSFGADEDLLKNSRRIGILENGADMSLVPYCGIMQFCTVDDNYDIKVYAPEDRLLFVCRINSTVQQSISMKHKNISKNRRKAR